MTRIPFVDGDWDFWALYDDGEWEPETQQVLERFLRPHDLFVDIGAWIGPVSLWALGLSADVIAYEPDPVAYEQLQANAPDVVAYRAAIGAQTGTGSMTSSGRWGDSMSRLSTGDECPTEVLSAMDAVAQWSRVPALIKMDVEGAEVDILPTLAPWCAEHRVPLFVSWHEDMWGRSVVERNTWFDRFSSTEGGWGGYDTLLAVP